MVYTNHYALRYLMAKRDAKPRLIRWVPLLQKFKVEVKYRKGTYNQVANHFPRLEDEAMRNLEKRLKLMMYSQMNMLWARLSI